MMNKTVTDHPSTRNRCILDVYIPLCAKPWLKGTPQAKLLLQKALALHIHLFHAHLRTRNICQSAKYSHHCSCTQHASKFLWAAQRTTVIANNTQNYPDIDYWKQHHEVAIHTRIPQKERG